MERWDEVLLNQGKVLVMVSTARHHGLPPPHPLAKTCKWPCSRSGPPTISMSTCCPTPPTSTPPLLKKFLGTLEQRKVPTYGQLLFFLGGLIARLGLAVEDLRDDIFTPPPDLAALAGPPVCTHYPTFVTCSAMGLHVALVRGGEVVIWLGLY